MTTWDMRFRALPGYRMEPGDELPALIAKAAEADGLAFADGDVVVVAQKVVSKAEGHVVRLDEMAPTPQAKKLAGAPGGMPGCASSTWMSPRRSSKSGACTWSPCTGWACRTPGPGGHVQRR